MTAYALCPGVWRVLRQFRTKAGHLARLLVAVALLVCTPLSVAAESVTKNPQAGPAPESKDRSNRQAYLEEYGGAMKYMGSRERQRSAAIPRLEALKKLDPTASENLHLDYCIAIMWLSDLQPTYGERSDDEKFIEQVERMRQAYPDRLNDIRMVYLLRTLDNEIGPAVRWRNAEAERNRLRAEREAAGIEEPREPLRKPELNEDQKATIARMWAFLREGKDKVIPSPECPFGVDFLVDGAVGRLVGLYCHGTDTLEEKLAAMDRLITEFRSDPRTSGYAAVVESKKKWHIEQYALKLHPNPPTSPEKPVAPVVEPPRSSAWQIILVRVVGTGLAVTLLVVAVRLLAKGRRRSAAFVAALGVVVGAWAWMWRPHGGLELMLEVREPIGVSRQSEPVTSGVPLPKGAMKDAHTLELRDARGSPLPCQFSPLGAWPDGSIKWVLLDSQTTVSASNRLFYTLRGKGPALPPGERVTVSLCRISSDGIAPDSGTSAATNGIPALAIDSGPLRIGLVTNRPVSDGPFPPGLIHSIVLNGKRVVCPTNPVQTVLVDASNRTFRASWPTAVKVEQNGPMRATVLVQGCYTGEDGSTLLGGKVSYDLRVTVYAGQPFVKLDFTLKNHGWYGYRNERKPKQWLLFKSLECRVPLNVQDAAPEVAAGENARFACGWTALRQDTVRLGQWLRYPPRDVRGMHNYVWQEALHGQDREESRALARARPNPHDEYMRPGPYYFLERLSKQSIGGASRLASGQKPAEAWCERLDGEDRVLGVAVRRFWQNAPKALSVRRDALTVALWPAGGYWPRTEEAGEAMTYQFEGGREKTASMIFVFGRDGPGAAALAKALDYPLIAEAAPSWYRDTQAVWPLGTAGLTAQDPELNEALARYDRLQLAKVHAGMGDPAGPLGGKPDAHTSHGTAQEDAAEMKAVHKWQTESGQISIPLLWERCPEVFYGWMNFGDLVWSHGYCSLFYDWPYQMLLQHLRFRDRAMWDVAHDMCRHRYDIDQYHMGDTAEWLGYFQRYEKGEHGHLDRQPKHNRQWEHNTAPSHTWNRGLLLYWAMTGDPRAFQAAWENGEAYYRFFFRQHKLAEKEKLLWNEFRSPGWAIENWLALYEYTGQSQYLDWANVLFTKTLLAMERDNGSRGHILKDGKQPAQFTAYIVEPICRLHHLTGRKDVAEFLRRVLDWEREKGSVGGRVENGRYLPVAFIENWGDVEPDDALDVGVEFDFLFADGYAYLYKLFGREGDLAFARRLFRDSLFHFSHGKGADPAARSPLGYHEFGSPFAMAAKLHAYSGRYHQIYLRVEEELGIARKQP